jgi:small subunit ribosomal protein S10
MNSKVQLILKSYSKESLSLYVSHLQILILRLNIKASIFNFPKKRKVITLLKSPHVNKKAKEQFELKYFKTSIFFTNGLSLKVVKNILVNKPKSVSLKIKM